MVAGIILAVAEAGNSGLICKKVSHFGFRLVRDFFIIIVFLVSVHKCYLPLVNSNNVYILMIFDYTRII